MKYFIWIFSLFFSLSWGAANGQQGFQEKDYLTGLKDFKQLPLDSIWNYAKDTVGLTANPTYVVTISLQDLEGKPIPWNGSGWFQKIIVLPDSLRGQAISFRMGHFGASEIYLDGKKIAGYGMVSSDPATLKTFVPKQPFIVVPGEGNTHTLRVHFANRLQVKPGDVDFIKGFWLTMAPSVLTHPESALSYNHYMVSWSFIAAFFLFFSFVFGFYPKRLASLMAALWLLDFSFLFLSYLLAKQATDGEAFRLLSLCWQAATSLLNGFIVLFYYALYYGRIPRRGWIVVALMVSILVIVFSVPEFMKFSGIFFILFYIEITRMIVLGIRHQRKGFWILAIGQGIGLLLFLSVIANAFGIFPGNSISVSQEIAGIFSDLCYPLMLSLQLAWEFGSSNRDLQMQLRQVHVLSEQNIEKEKEKQIILSSQNETLEKQVRQRTIDLSHSLEELKETQSQLVQREKMASLGELTAGIAHEIQNPLNFVNNFSDVNNELLVEMKEEMDMSHFEEAKALIKDVMDIQEKINYHGKRADAIVKGMLQHSRSSAGVMEQTDINNLVDEYIRLSYHGLHAKDEKFNATFQTVLDPAITPIKIVPQDIGRALLNIFNNAFYYAIKAQGDKNSIGRENGPQVLVTTKLLPGTSEANQRILITVRDNGTGIPANILDKVFQPFFTTKPTGQGTGLGLSLAYEIFKAHGGALSVETKEGEYTEFTVRL